MFKRLTRRGISLALAVILLMAFAPNVSAAGDTQWKQLYFDNIRSAADYVAQWSGFDGPKHNEPPGLFGMGILDIALADLNFDGIPELLYAEDIPAGAGNHYVHILTVSNGSVSELAAYEVIYGQKYLPTLSSNSAGDLAYTVTAAILYETSYGPDYKTQPYLFNSSITMDNNILSGVAVSASVQSSYSPVSYNRAAMGRSMSGVGYWGLEGPTYTDAEIWAMLDSYVSELGFRRVTATPTNTRFMLNDEEVALPAYIIENNNYVKLRDVAALLETRFDVRWEDGKAKLYNHAAYTAVGGELAGIGTGNKIAELSNTDFVWGETGEAIAGLTAYNIDSNNYIKLRDIAQLFDFDVDWRDGKAWIEPDVSPYTPD